MPSKDTINKIVEDDELEAERLKLEPSLDALSTAVRLEGDRDEPVVLQFNDWNRNDQHYTAPRRLVEELGTRIRREGVKKAWDWWVTLIGYEVERNTTWMGTHGFDYFLAWDDSEECVNEWEDL